MVQNSVQTVEVRSGPRIVNEERREEVKEGGAHTVNLKNMPNRGRAAGFWGVEGVVPLELLRRFSIHHTFGAPF